MKGSSDYLGNNCDRSINSSLISDSQLAVFLKQFHKHLISGIYFLMTIELFDAFAGSNSFRRSYLCKTA
jgi:hypothetical protein